MPRPEIGGRTKAAWLAIGAVSLIGLVVVTLVLQRRPSPFSGGLPVTRAEAEAKTRQELQKRGVTLGPKWRVLTVPDDGSDGPHQFVVETAGEARWRELVGVYLPKPRWRVRVATFEGDVADRAEEWRTYVTSTGEIRNIRHEVPEARPGASLDEPVARQRAVAAVKDRLGLDAAAGQIKEVSAKPEKQKARTDWRFTFTDTTITLASPKPQSGEGGPLPQGEPRIDVDLAGDEVASVARYIYVPEEWERRQRAASTRNTVIQVAVSVVFGGLLLAAAIAGMIAWSRGQFSPRLFLAASAMVLMASIVSFANGWPALLANLSTAVPLAIQLLGILAVGLVGFALLSAVIGLAIGGVPHRLAGLGTISDRDAVTLGVAAGLAGAAVAAIAAVLRTPAWALFPSVSALGTMVPFVATAVDPVAGFLTRLAVMTAALVTIDRITGSWTRRRAVGALLLAAIGFLSAGVPVSGHAPGWAAAGVIVAVALMITYITLLRFDLTLIPVALGTMIGAGVIARGAHGAYPEALPGSIAGALLLGVVSWFWFRALRRAQADIFGNRINNDK